MKTLPAFSTFIFLIIFGPGAFGQGIIKGTISDNQSQLPLVGASVLLLGSDPLIGATSDLDGKFSLANVPIGRQAIQISYLGYRSVTLPNILVSAGKDVILEITMEESTLSMQEVVITAEVEKDKSINQMATVSARMFTLEEVTRYSGGRNDASRMVANFAGVNINNDSRNDIVIRGNSPIGVLWRLEGMPIPNPNHFATLGTTGGPVSALNTNLLKNSDFITSAFPAEYGNANAGVFDIQFRSGNKDKFEFTAQLAAFSGMEFMVEGPTSKQKKGSFVASYRHSFVELAHVVGLRIGTQATPNYKDFTFKLDFGKSKTGHWSVFGIGGLSDIDFLASEVQSDDFFANPGEDSYAKSLIGLIGINHRILLDGKSYLRTTLGVSTAQNTFNTDQHLENGVVQRNLEVDDKNTRLTYTTYYNRKFNARITGKIGILAEWYYLDASARELENAVWIPRRNFKDGLGLYQIYSQWQWKLNERFTVNAGIHGQWLALNNDFAWEPRAAFKWILTENSSLNLGIGVHHQMLPLPIYLYEIPLPDGTFDQSNRQNDFIKSNHYVLGYDRKFGTDWRIKAEIYYQDISEVRVEQQSSSFSMLNVGDDFAFPQVGFLQNSGTGRNYGVELTIEKFFSKNYYLLVTGSLFDSEYQGSDGIDRNTAFNNNYILNFLAGREFPIRKNHAITFDMKWTTAGGRFYTPIDLDRSITFNTEIKRHEIAYSERYDPYVRLDLKFGFRLNNPRKKISQQFYLDFQNVTNHKNIFLQRFNTGSKKIETIYQIGFFPDILYRIQF